MRRSILNRSLALGGFVTLTASPAFAISPIAQAVITAVWSSLVPSMTTLLAALTAAGASLWVARIIMRKFSADTETGDFGDFELQAEESNIDAARRRAIERSNGGLNDEMGGHLNDPFGEYELDWGGDNH